MTLIEAGPQAMPENVPLLSVEEKEGLSSSRLQAALRSHPSLLRALFTAFGRDFLIFDPRFPRSVCFCLAECRKAIHAISGRPLGECDNDAEPTEKKLSLKTIDKIWLIF